MLIMIVSYLLDDLIDDLCFDTLVSMTRVEVID